MLDNLGHDDAIEIAPVLLDSSQVLNGTVDIPKPIVEVNVTETAGRLGLRAQLSHDDVLLERIDGSHLSAETRQRLGQDATATADVEKVETEQRLAFQLFVCVR